MLNEVERREIPYFEYRAINQVVHGHIDELGETLQAIITFGPLVTRGDTHDIDLLEIVKDWKGPSKYQAASSSILPLRGNLYFNFVSSADFQKFADGPQSSDMQKLMERVLKGYEIIYESPTGYARDILEAAINSRNKSEGGIQIFNPLSPPVSLPPLVHREQSA